MISESSPSPDIGFQLAILLKPDAWVMEIPFATKDSIIPSAALYLNELNIMSYKNQIVSEEVFMSHLQNWARGSITNKDISSLFPHHNISGSVFNLLVGWWLGKSFFLRFLSFNTSRRLNAQTDDDDVIIFPVDFLPRILTGKIDSMVEEVLRKYPRLIYSQKQSITDCYDP